MVLVAVALIFAAGFALSAYLYDVAGRKTCPRCGSRRTYMHGAGTPPGAPFYVCRACGATFSGNSLGI